MSFQAASASTMTHKEVQAIDHWRDVPLAVFDARREYRYALRREWSYSTTDRCVLWVMLNPSTADENELDPTLRRCAGFSSDWGFGGMLVANVFAYRSTNPKNLRSQQDPIGCSNYVWLHRLAKLADKIVVGYGAQPIVRERRPDGYRPDRLALKALTLANKPVFCLGLTMRGFPKHPLYLPKSLTPVEFSV